MPLEPWEGEEGYHFHTDVQKHGREKHGVHHGSHISHYHIRPVVERTHATAEQPDGGETR